MTAIPDAHIKQLAAIGYNRQEICRKLNISMSHLTANHINAYREGQRIYVRKVIEQDKRQNG